MSRVRSRAGNSYTARLQRRGVVARPRTVRVPAARVAGVWWLALLAVGAEAGHLAAAFIEWPGSPARGAFHVTVAAVQGLAAVAGYTGASRLELLVALVLNALVPIVWLAGSIAGAGPYHSFPILAAAAVTAVEAALATLLTWAFVRRV
jgi:hypothetical protein